MHDINCASLGMTLRHLSGSWKRTLKVSKQNSQISKLHSYAKVVVAIRQTIVKLVLV